MLTSIEHLKKILTIPLDVTEEDEVLNTVLAHASTQIESYCGREFQIKTFEERHSGGNSSIFLGSSPLHEIIEFKVDGIDAINDENYLAFSAGFIDCISGYFPKGRYNIFVKYVGGFETIPPDIVGATCLLAGYYYKNFDEKLFVIKSKSKGDETVNFQNDIPDDVLRVIKGYRVL